MDTFVSHKRRVRAPFVKWAVAAGLACVVACACVGLYVFGDASLRRHQQGRPLRIGYAIEPPYAYLTPEGEVTGESPEVAKRIAARLGFSKVEWRCVEFGSLIGELEADRIDVIAAGLYVTPERARRVAFSEATFQVRSGLLVAPGNPKRLHAPRQVVGDAGVRLAVLAGSVEEALYRSLGVPDSRLVVVPDALTGQSAVASGLANALALSSPSVLWMARRTAGGRVEEAHPFEALAGEKLGCGAFAFRKEDRALLRAWNRELLRFVGSEEHAALVAAFGFVPSDLPHAIARGEGHAP